jgi:hypothetical protein
MQHNNKLGGLENPGQGRYLVVLAPIMLLLIMGNCGKAWYHTQTLQTDTKHLDCCKDASNLK